MKSYYPKQGIKKWVSNIKNDFLILGIHFFKFLILENTIDLFNDRNSFFNIKIPFYIKNEFLDIRKICWFISIRKIEFLIFEIKISSISKWFSNITNEFLISKYDFLF